MLSPGEKKFFSILIVDDTPKNIQVLGTFLNKEGYQVIVAQNGMQALSTVEKTIPDLILLDIMMPGMDGFTVCERLKGDAKTRNIPVIFLTAKTDSDSILQGFETGAVDYVTKPFQKGELLARVETHLELQGVKERLLQKNSEQKELLHILCHDLMNPIGVVQSFLEIMEEQPDFFAQAKPHIAKAMGNAKDIIDLIRQIQGIEEGKIQLTLASINLKEAISESLMLLKHKFTKKEIEAVVSVNEALHVQAEMTSLVNSVLNNLLTNAVKYSFSGSQVIIEAQPSGSQVVLSIRDAGMGIPEQLLETIFEIHKPTTRRGTDGELGTGFGMPLVKKFVTAYGGTIEIFAKDQAEHPNDHGTEVKLLLKMG